MYPRGFQGDLNLDVRDTAMAALEKIVHIPQDVFVKNNAAGKFADLLSPQTNA